MVKSKRLAKKEIKKILEKLKEIQEEKIEKEKTKELDPYKIEITKSDLEKIEFAVGKSKLIEVIEDEIKTGQKPNLESITREVVERRREKKEEWKEKEEYGKDRYDDKPKYSEEIGIYKEKAVESPEYEKRHSTT